MQYYLGIDIGGTKCAVILGEEKDGSVRVTDKIKFETKVSRGWRKIVDEILESGEKLIERNNLGNEDIVSCGVSCGGPLDAGKGIIMCPPNLPDWDNVPLADIISGRFGFPCVVRNDADACALAEWKFGAGKGRRNMIFLTFGTGMGAGLILNGKLYSGTMGTAGEVGHIRLEPDGPIGYGKAGSFEGFCSGGGLADLGRRMLKEYEGKSILEGTEITAKSIAEAAGKGDELAVSVYKKCGEKLGCALSILIDILNPEKIVIGSIYQRSGNLLEESMREMISKEALSISAQCCEIVPALLGDEIGDYAALGVAGEKI